MNDINANSFGYLVVTDYIKANTGEDVSDLFPVHQVPAVIQRHSGIVLEAACHQIVVVSDAAYARVRIESADDGIDISLCRGCCDCA